METLHMNAHSSICGVCNEAITNPICPKCLEEEITQWLKARAPELVPLVKGVSDISTGFEYASTKCIICGGKVSICAHCFSSEIYSQLKLKNPELAEEFARSFDFELSPAPD